MEIKYGGKLAGPAIRVSTLGYTSG